MERKTHLTAEEGKQELEITRVFALPVDLLFKAYAEPDLVEQWMSTKVLKLDNKPHGGWRFETTDAQGNVVFQAHGVVHTFVPNQQIVRTFEMSNAGFPPQLEFLEFERLTDDSSQLRMHIVFRSVADRDQLLRLPFAYGLNMAHDRLQEVVSNSLSY
ncbi:Uncharacterized conserved protein YndB, AHSA1/START domain [Catalinimonas alkaloidigena]|uniref:Uncharacterized conserved protein YndB, AHSA1/START domain n=1 Tax=Catalinimonas alkaloidigena TaxID=1075417 RepID=A0A1G9GCC0_9BACT|nr:SRPBCC domain-containing protein [Catalinimonas alkaloidigena]SDK98267.1 Uncharacterized conserved protein YndB, AHSA1/START domain [Catalinimonas alkaloidigena]